MGERSFSVDLDTQGTVLLQAWWHANEAVATSTSEEGMSFRGGASFRSSASKSGWLARGRKKLRKCCSARVWCRYLTGRVMHPDSRFRSGWNVGLAFLICCTVRHASHTTNATGGTPLLCRDSHPPSTLGVLSHDSLMPLM